MDRGRIIAQGKPRDLIAEHAAESVIEIQGPDEDLKGYLRQENVNHDDLGERVVIYTDSRGELEKEVRDRFCMESCLFRAGNLEDVFLRLTGRGLRE
jgi:lipooligosaccharide transport system ATP-binding protein